MRDITLPSLRALAGRLSSRKTTSTSTNRGLHGLQGGLTQNDLDLEDVVNALRNELDGVPTGLLDYTTTSGRVNDPSWATVASFDVTPLIDVDVMNLILVEADVLLLSDDGLETGGFRLARTFHWNSAGPTLSADGDLVKTNLRAAWGGRDARFGVSGTNVTIEVDAADQFYFQVVRRTAVLAGA